MEISIHSLVLGMVQTNCYLITNEATKEAVIIDPAGEADRLCRFIDSRGLKPVAVLLTHGHFDHVMAVPEVTKKYGIKAYAHEDEAEVMASPYLNGCEMIGARVSVKPDEVFTDKAKLVFGDMLFEVIFTPGHTQGGVCFYMPQVKKLLCGDTLFEASVGRTDLPTGSMSTLIRSIRERLFVLDDDVEALPGHGPSTTIGYEKKYNPFL